MRDGKKMTEIAGRATERDPCEKELRERERQRERFHSRRCHAVRPARVCCWHCHPLCTLCAMCANLVPTARPALSLYPADATQSSLTDSRHRASTHPVCEEGVAGPDTRGRSTHRDAKYSDNFHQPCVTYPHPQVSEKQTHFPLLS